MIEVNLLGAITSTEVFLDQLRGGGGDVVNISSVAGRTAWPGNGVYTATKWGMDGWSESLRSKLLPDVRVSLIEAGAVATELPNHITYAATKEGMGSSTARSRLPRRTSPRRSPSSSAGRGASPSTRFCCDPAGQDLWSRRVRGCDKGSLRAGWSLRCGHATWCVTRSRSD